MSKLLKPLLLSIVLLSTSSNATGITHYTSESDMKEYVSLLAQVSLLYKETGDSRMLNQATQWCRVLPKLWYNTPEYVKTPNMERWNSSIETICNASYR